MLIYNEMAAYGDFYDTAVSCARALVNLVSRVMPHRWAHVGESCRGGVLMGDMIVSFDIFLTFRFLYKEAQRLLERDQETPSMLAFEEANLLYTVLSRDISRFLPMAITYACTLQRVKEGLGED